MNPGPLRRSAALSNPVDENTLCRDHVEYVNSVLTCGRRRGSGLPSGDSLFSAQGYDIRFAAIATCRGRSGGLPSLSEREQQGGLVWRTGPPAVLVQPEPVMADG